MTAGSVKALRLYALLKNPSPPHPIPPLEGEGEYIVPTLVPARSANPSQPFGGEKVHRTFPPPHSLEREVEKINLS